MQSIFFDLVEMNDYLIGIIITALFIFASDYVIIKHMKNINNQKGFIAIFALLIAVAIIGYFSYRALIQPGDNPRTEGLKKQLETAEDATKSVNNRVKEINQEVNKIVEEKPEEENLIEVKLKINNNGEIKIYPEKIEPGGTVFDLMKKIKETGDFDFKYQDSSMGVFVEEINGVKNNPSKNMFWLFYVNNKPSVTSVSNYKLLAGDEIEWKFEDVTGMY
jgi:hypothetical protein